MVEVATTNETSSNATEVLSTLAPFYLALLAFVVLFLTFMLIRLSRMRSSQNRARQASKEDRQRRQLLVMNHLKDQGRRSFKQLLRATRMTPPQLVIALDYLESRSLISQDKSIWKPSWMDDRVYGITAQGIDEVDNGRDNPLKDTAHLGPQILVTGGSVGDITVQSGSGNTQSTGDNSRTLGGAGNIQESPAARISPSAALDFTEDFRAFLDEFGRDATVRSAAEKRLAIIESSIGSSDEIEEIKSSGERALKLADGIAVSVAGRAAYEALRAVWDRVLN